MKTIAAMTFKVCLTTFRGENLLLTEEQKRALAETILDCVKKAITPKFGENVYRVIFSNFNTRFGFREKDIISHPKEFEQVLDDIFGTGIASQLIKRPIFNELANRFQIFDTNYYERNQEKGRSIISKAISEILNKAE